MTTGAPRKAYAVVLSMATMIVFGAPVAAQAGTEEEVRAVFGKFVAAQNAHDLSAVGEIIEDSPQFLWITRGVQYWGRDAALKRFAQYYQGTWVLEPRL